MSKYGSVVHETCPQWCRRCIGGRPANGDHAVVVASDAAESLTPAVDDGDAQFPGATLGDSS